MKNEKKKNLIFIAIGMVLVIGAFFMMFIASNNKSNMAGDGASKDTNHLSVNGIKYPKTLFDDSKVHTIDIKVDNKEWGNMVKNAEKEEYIACSMLIDGVKVDNVGLRPKGNSSLKQISVMKSENFSFKVEFDHYLNQTFDGLDKLILNNCTQDTTYMKDYLAQHMMNYMGVAAPLTSFVNITLNGKAFGFYLAVEAVEESFCLRNYGNIDGKLYKPDSLAISNFDFAGIESYKMKNGKPAMDYFMDIMSGEAYKDFHKNTRLDALGDLVSVLLKSSNICTDVSGLVYMDDNPESYKTIFDTEVFDAKKDDKKRLIKSIKKLNKGQDLSNTLDIESLIKYFVVHNFVDNYDGYTSIFSHNYYLYEQSGKLSMVPWDYNLAFGCFTMDAGSSSTQKFSDYLVTKKAAYGMSYEKSMVNYPIDTPIFTVDIKERPMIHQILSNEKYYDLYHRYFDEFISRYFESGHFDNFYTSTVKMISPYVKSDAKGFYAFGQFEEGTRELNKFCSLRAKSVRGQLNKIIPSTLEGQKENPQSLIDTKDLDIMKTLDFSTMISVMGISVEDINDILKTTVKYIPDKYLTGGKIDVSKFTMDEINSLKKNIGVIAPIMFQVVKDNSVIRNKLIKAFLPKILLILVLLVVIIFAIKQFRIRLRTKCMRDKITM